MNWNVVWMSVSAQLYECPQCPNSFSNKLPTWIGDNHETENKNKRRRARNEDNTIVIPQPGSIFMMWTLPFWARCLPARARASQEIKMTASNNDYKIIMRWSENIDKYKYTHFVQGSLFWRNQIYNIEWRKKMYKIWKSQQNMKQVSETRWTQKWKKETLKYQTNE